MGRQVGEFDLANDEKLERAIHGSVTRMGQQSGGVGENASDTALLAEYDKLGGLILKNGLKVKIGSFYDFKKRAPREVPEVSFLSEVDGEIVEVSEDEAVALKVAREKISKVKAKKSKKVVEVKGEEEEQAPVKLKKIKREE